MLGQGSRAFWGAVAYLLETDSHNGKCAFGLQCALCCYDESIVKQWVQGQAAVR